MLQRVLSTVHSLVERLRSRSSARYIQAEVEDEHEEVSQPPQLIPLGAPAGVLTVNLKTCRDFSKSAPLKKGSRAAVRITIGRTVKYTVQQPYSDPMCFDEWKHFSLQIQKEDICGVQQSSLVVVELIMVDPDLTTPVIIGRDTIMLQEILKKSSLSHQFNLRLMQKKVCKLDADLAFSYGSMGYGYSHQIKHAGRTIESLVEKSLFPRCPPNEDRDPLCNVITPSARTRLDFIPSVMLQAVAQKGELFGFFPPSWRKHHLQGVQDGGAEKKALRGTKQKTEEGERKRCCRDEEKLLKVVERQQPDELKVMPVEVALLQIMSQPPICKTIIQLIEWFDEPECYILILEHPDPCKSLDSFLQDYGGYITEDMAKDIMWQSVVAVFQT
ncbi:hypothetical protein SRHO_G00059470 [Serrasalmus rhombeus]